MIEEVRGHIDYDECGDGPTIVLVPESCSTGAAWRPVIGALVWRFRSSPSFAARRGGNF
jgi:hypothetical protein